MEMAVIPDYNIKDSYLQNYLDEFCYKTNRCYFGENLFDKLMVASFDNTWASLVMNEDTHNK